MTDSKNHIEAVFTNELLIHYVFMQIRPKLRNGLFKLTDKVSRAKWRDWYCEKSDPEVRKVLDTYQDLSNREFIDKMDDFGCLKTIRHVSCGLYRNLKSKVESNKSGNRMHQGHIRSGYRNTDEAERDRFKRINSLSDSLMNVRGLYAHSRGDGCSYDEAVSGMDLMIGLCKELDLDKEAEETIRTYRNLLPDPTRNEYLAFRITVNGGDVSDDVPEDLIDGMDSGTAGEVRVDGIEKGVKEGTAAISLELFYELLKRIDGIDYRENPEQKEIIEAGTDENLRVIAGPGSGKTAVLSLHVLKSILVDGLDPSSILVTTFTRKAAKEISDRIVSKGESLRKTILYDPDVLIREKDRIRDVDFNEITLGTLDSIAYSIISENLKGDQKPTVLVEDFISHSILGDLYSRLDDAERMRISREFSGFELEKGDGQSPRDAMSEFCFSLEGLISQNNVSLDSIKETMPSTYALICSYKDRIGMLSLSDFSDVERDFLDFINSDESASFTDSLRMLLVDEYQDTNILQEELYCSLAKKIIANGGSFKVVGDDDQSLYRFRGSKVELFTDMDERVSRYGISVDTKYLSTNYRSTKEIVDFCNAFLQLDEEYSDSRGDKPDIVPGRTEESFPVFGIFDDCDERVAKFLVGIFGDYVSGKEVKLVSKDGHEYSFRKGPDSEDSDFVFLSSSPKEGSKNSMRMPGYIHQYLDGSKDLELCNPRGVPMEKQEYLADLGALMVLCLDPERDVWRSLKDNENYQNDSRILNFLDSRADRVEGNLSEYPKDLGEYVRSWRKGELYTDQKWNGEVPVIRIIYDLAFLMGERSEDPDNMVYLESALRTTDQCTQLDRGAAKVRISSKHKVSSRSVADVYTKVLIPVFKGQISLDEDLIYRRSMKGKFSIMSIHQSKGLEFPIVVVDTRSNKYTPKYMDYERDGCEPDDVRNMNGIISEQLKTKGLDDDTDDDQYNELIRKYYVAFSRARKILIVVGPEDPDMRVLNIGAPDEYRDRDPDFPRIVEVKDQ